VNKVINGNTAARVDGGRQMGTNPCGSSASSREARRERLLPARFRWLACSVVLVLASTAGAAAAQTLVYSPDITSDLSGVTFADEDVAADNLLGMVAPQPLGSLPAQVEVDAYQLLGSGDQLFSLDTTAALPGGLVARPGDVVRYDGATYGLEFDADAEGVPDGAGVDAVAVDGMGNLLLSFDTTVDLGGGLVASDEDLVSFDGSSFAMRFDGSAVGLAESLDLDGAAVGSLGALYLSFDTTGSIGGWTFDDDTVMRYNGTTWTPLFETDFTHPGFEGGDLIALPEPGVLPGLGATLALLACLQRLRGGARRRP
jgi:hypothetical protein